MPKLTLVTMLLLCSINARAESSICNGTWENGQPVHVVVDWDRGNVNVNGVVTKIFNATSEGIFTTQHMNKFGHLVSFAIVNSTYNAQTKGGIFLYSSANRATFVMQADIDTQTANFSHGLYCSKSFTKPLMARVL